MTRWIRGPAAAAALCGLFGPGAAAAAPLLSEVFYDAAGSDDGRSFVELYAAPGTSLEGLVIEGVNGSNGSLTDSIALSGVVGASGLFVVADVASDGASEVPGADLLADFDFQNGPDSVVLRDGTLVLDALGYGAFGEGDVFAGEGTPAPDAPSDFSLARRFANVDSDDNAADFAVATPSPGTAPLAPLPEPDTLALLAFGLAGLAVRGGAQRPAR